MKTTSVSRRRFVQSAAGAATGVVLFPALACSTGTPSAPADNSNLVGPLPGYSPQIGTLVSMMHWMRGVVLSSVQSLGQSQLDHLFDPQANIIGAMLLHLAATEAFYQATTFDGRNGYNAQEQKRWGAVMGLGPAGRHAIKGQDLPYYLATLQEVREKTLTELRRRDDAWLAAVDPAFFGNQPTNNYCKWFHVVEHESNHNGQIKWLKSRLPGAKPAEE
ncbi:DinB family protein [Hymenobacter weizhouensis]|uniref:DinB family protein n=1 Tax=Hymenobacter sp. YIM 151500-1 TaxID=2987689 RepID=UPI00222681E7|nr:DinB family protein [Hymenobacter sp. YIM 151500-1]UYZ63524.1 DinB family protein [Hymenobacter sp. YIM 151500-1]